MQRGNNTMARPIVCALRLTRVLPGLWRLMHSRMGRNILGRGHWQVLESVQAETWGMARTGSGLAASEPGRWAWLSWLREERRVGLRLPYPSGRLSRPCLPPDAKGSSPTSGWHGSCHACPSCGTAPREPTRGPASQRSGELQGQERKYLQRLLNTTDSTCSAVYPPICCL